MAGRQLAALARRLRKAGWAADTPVSVVVSRRLAGCAGQRAVGTLGRPRCCGGRPTVVTVGAGAAAVSPRWQIPAS